MPIPKTSRGHMIVYLKKTIYITDVFKAQYSKEKKVNYTIYGIHVGMTLLVIQEIQKGWWFKTTW